MSATKRGRGKPPKLSFEIQEKICDALKIGCFIESAAAYAGIDRSTIYKWLKRGRAEKTGRYYEFVDAVEIAIEYGHAALVQRLHTESQGDWRGTLAMLERKFPKQWAPREISKQEPPDTKPEDSAFEGDSVNAFVARELDKIEDDRWEE